MIVEGKNPVRELLNSDRTVEKLYIEKDTYSKDLKELVNMAKDKKINVTYVDKLALDSYSATKRHQGAVAFTSKYTYFSTQSMIKAAKAKDKPLFLLILDGIEDPHNLGSIVRVAECVGVDGVIIPKHRAVGVTDTVCKISEGAIEHLKIAKVTNINDTIRELKEKNVFVYCADMDGDSIYRTNLTGDIAIVIGGEGTGVKPLTKKLCDGVVSLPQFGKINSLNASVATGAVLYECVRQREKL